MSDNNESPALVLEPSCPWGSKKSQATPESTKVHEATEPQLLLRWLKFNLVGGIGIGVQLVALTTLRSLFHFDYLLATGLAVETAVLHNFLWHERFTWAERRHKGGLFAVIRLVRFSLSNGMVSLAGNLLLMRLLVGNLRMNYLVASLIAIATCSLANFIASDRLVFTRS